jgi:cysteine-rich repeat protein
VSLEDVIDLADNGSLPVENTNVMYDSTSVAITDTAPAAGSTVNNANVSYTLSEQAQSGTITFSSGDDPGSPRAYTLTGAELASGAHTDLDTALSLVSGAIYTVSFDATDMAGNPATTVSNASVTFAICGDGLKSGTEQCDDNNTDNNDGCSATCTIGGWTTTAQFTECLLSHMR